MEKKRKRRIENPRSHPSSFSFDQGSFPLMLAAVANLHNPHARSLIKRLLRHNLVLISKPLPLRWIALDGLLAILPALLASTFSSVAVFGLEVVGAIALCSLESNAVIASDCLVVKCLVWRTLGSRSKHVIRAACDAVMDLSTSPMGRDRLRESKAIEKLFYLFCQVTAIPSKSISPRNMEKRNTKCNKRKISNDNLSYLVVRAVLVLVNTSTGDCLYRIPECLVKRVLSLLVGIWGKMCDSELSIVCDSMWGLNSLCNMKTELAGTIFRLSTNQSNLAVHKPDEIKTFIFGSAKSEFENFLLNNWEASPRLFKRASKHLEDNNIFGSLHCSFNPKPINSLLDSILQGLISCPPIASDELDIDVFLNEVKDILGSPILHGQDIRVLKTEKRSSGPMLEETEKEMHFFKEIVESEIKDGCFVEKCKKAIREGYTIALRGMEFRNDTIAAISDGLAALFGQPSAGANIYLTPPGSQGLAQHYDDHCVFVCQIYGCKRWKISPRPMDFLPRLYEPLGRLPNLEEGVGECMQVLLEEGDILYIPRGCPHEAQTSTDEGESASTEFSFHLTLGIEVEPPFEWEGFAHIALHCWHEKQKDGPSHTIDSKSRRLSVAHVNLLHVSIRLIADQSFVFRKACMINALPLAYASKGANSFMMRQNAIFSCILNEINNSCCFVEASKIVETAVRERDVDSFLGLGWLQHLPQEGNSSEKVKFSNLLEVFEDIFTSINENTEEAMVEFSHIKSKFCRDAAFEDTCKSYTLLLDKYRKTRKQYMHGMLALHVK